MTSERRAAAVAALVELAQSRDYRDRADAGRGLASLAERPEAREALSNLILDVDDTFVTCATAEALLRRKDTVGLGLVASALAVAESSYSDWIFDTVVAVFGVFSTDRDTAVQLCEALSQSGDEHVSLGAGQLITMLTEIKPVLFPTEAKQEDV